MDKRFFPVFPFFVSFFIIITPVQGVCDFPYPGSGNWIINSSNSPNICENEIIILNGNLLINEIGNLTFRNVTLRVNASSDGEYRIESNGSLYIYNSDLNSSSGFAYLFWVNSGSSFVMENSKLHRVGYGEEKGISGFYIEADSVKITNNEISENYYGIFLHSNDSEISHNQIISNSIGLMIDGSRNVIHYNNISENGIGSFIEGSNNKFEHNVLIDNGDGGLSVKSRESSINNNTIENSHIGIYLEGNDNNITNSYLFLNDLYGLSITGDNNKILNTILTENYEGIYLLNTTNTEIKNTLSNESVHYDIHLSSAKDTIITNTNYTTLAREWWLEVKVVDSSDSPVEDAGVFVVDKNEDEVMRNTTDSEGLVSGSIFELLENKSRTDKTFNPYTIDVVKVGYLVNITTLNITSDTTVKITLMEEVTEAFFLIIESPENRTYLGNDLDIHNSLLPVAVTSNLNLSSCAYKVENSTDLVYTGAMNNVTANSFRGDLNVSILEGRYKLTVSCNSTYGRENSSSLWFSVYPDYTCLNNDDCTSNQECKNFQCVNLECVCGEPSNHTCVYYECCDNDQCSDDEFCDISEHICREVSCTCGYIENHRCVRPDDYCCTDIHCGMNQTCDTSTHRCITRTLSVSIIGDLVAGQNVTVYVRDQNNETVSNVKLTVNYIRSGTLETFYTNINGYAEIPIKEAGLVEFTIRKAGYVTNSTSFEAAAGFSFFPILIVIVIIIGVSGIFLFKKFSPFSPLRLEKTTSYGVVMLKIKNRTRKTLSNILVIDQVPSGSFLRCNIIPTIEPRGNVDELIWNILELQPKEEVVIEYETYQALGKFRVKIGEKEYST
jgi:parallel beta-helix repeat protein